MSEEKIITIKVLLEGSGAAVKVEHGNDVTFQHVLAACEFLMHAVSQNSPCGYERAMELLPQAAMNYVRSDPGVDLKDHFEGT